MNQVFNRVPNARPGRSTFDLSYSKLFTADMGILYPVCHDIVVPGDKWNISNHMVLRANPLVSPIVHPVKIDTHYFYVKMSDIWDDWETFITGGPDGTDATALPRWSSPTSTAEESLWDLFGMPTGVTPHSSREPVDFMLRAYNLVYNEYYRDQTLQTEKNLTDDDVLSRNWEKGYFTSSLPWRQRGTAPALPISGTTSAVFSGDVPLSWPAVSGGSTATIFYYRSTNNYPNNTGTKTALELGHVDQADINSNTVDLSSATTFSVTDLRYAVAVQQWLERNARAGARYAEFVPAHYGVYTEDGRIGRPEYIGGTSSPLITSEVLGTNQDASTTEHGHLAGHGISIDQNYVGNWFAREHGIIIGLMSIMPAAVYQQGINRQWLQQDRYDFYFPEFNGLSEQAVENVEIYVQGTSADSDVFGYVGMYDEYRWKPNMVCGKMRSSFDHWHISRQFSALPNLNSAFITCSPRDDAWAVPSEPQFVVNYGNHIIATRPIPGLSVPGLDSI